MEQWYATGKRKTAVARVFLRPGNGEMKVNGRSVENYFCIDTNIQKIYAPFKVGKAEKKFDALVTVCGGGIAAQAEAVRNGIAKALVDFDAELRPELKKEGFLRRDARMKERKKYGQKGARARFQFSKR